jgi:hypothetical protein
MLAQAWAEARNASAACLDETIHLYPFAPGTTPDHFALPCDVLRPRARECRTPSPNNVQEFHAPGHVAPVDVSTLQLDASEGIVARGPQACNPAALLLLNPLEGVVHPFLSMRLGELVPRALLLLPGVHRETHSTARPGGPLLPFCPPLSLSISLSIYLSVPSPLLPSPLRSLRMALGTLPTCWKLLPPVLS